MYLKERLFFSYNTIYTIQYIYYFPFLFNLSTLGWCKNFRDVYSWFQLITSKTNNPLITMSLSKIYCRSTNCTMYIKCRQRIFFSLFNSFPLFKQIFGNKICQLGQNSYKRKVYWELYRGFPFIFITEHSHLYECPISKKYGQAAWKSKRIWCREK